MLSVLLNRAQCTVTSNERTNDKWSIETTTQVSHNEQQRERFDGSTKQTNKQLTHYGTCQSNLLTKCHV